MRIALYRCLYGEDFVQESIRSILPHVDRVIVVLASRPWGRSTGVHYQGVWVPWPKKFDAIRDRIVELSESRVEIIDDDYPWPQSQYEHILNELLADRPITEVIIMEPDWVFSSVEAERTFAIWESSGKPYAATRQIQLWKSPRWRIPERSGRATPTLFSLSQRSWKPQGFPQALDSICHNLGFCCSDTTIYWKHLTAMAFSDEVGDTPPNPDWYEDVWRSWHPETRNANLEVALNLAHKIPKAIPHPLDDLPELLRARFSHAGQ